MRLYLRVIVGLISIVCPVLCPASCVRHRVACVVLPPSVERGEASVGASAFPVPLGIDNAADGGFVRPAPAPAKAISVGTGGKFGSNFIGLRSASLTRRMAASHVQLRLPRLRYSLALGKSGSNVAGLRSASLTRRLARLAPALAKAISVGMEKFGSNIVGLRLASLTRRMAASHVQLRLPRRRYSSALGNSGLNVAGLRSASLTRRMAACTSSSGSREGNILWSWESSAPTPLGFALCIVGQMVSLASPSRIPGGPFVSGDSPAASGSGSHGGALRWSQGRVALASQRR